MATRIDELQRPVANDEDRHPSTIARKAVGTARYARQAILLGLRPYFAHRILGELGSPRDLDDWVRFVFRFRVTVGPPILELTFDLLPNQVPSEIRRLVKLVAREPPRTCLRRIW